MELTEQAKTYFTKLGINTSTVVSLFEEDSDIDVDSAINETLTVMKTKLKPQFEKEFTEQQQVEFGKARIKFMRDVNKTFDLGYTNDEVKDMEYKEFLPEAKTKVMEQFKGSDEERKAKYEEITAKYENSLNGIKTEYEAKLSKAQQDNQKYISENEFLSSWSTKQLGVSQEQKDFYKDAFLKEVSTKFKILPGKKIVNLDDTPVMNPKEDGLWTSIDDYLDYKIDSLKIGKVSGGSETGGSSSQSFQQSDKGKKEYKSSAADEILARAKAKGAIV